MIVRKEGIIKIDWTGSETADRNSAIWHSNRVLGIGTARLAVDHGLSRQRIKQIIAREDQKRQVGC